MPQRGAGRHVETSGIRDKGREVKHARRWNTPSSKPPSVIVLAGPNGAGKSTTASALLKGALGVTEFVDADTIARGLSAFQPERVALSAGRIMLTRLKELAAQRVSFAYETTLASRMFARWLAELRQGRYRVHILFLWLPSADFAVDRVLDRVRMGGHDVPEETFAGATQPVCGTSSRCISRWQTLGGSTIIRAVRVPD